MDKPDFIAPGAIRNSKADPKAKEIIFASNIDELREHLKSRQKLLEEEEENGEDQGDIERGSLQKLRRRRMDMMTIVVVMMRTMTMMI